MENFTYRLPTEIVFGHDQIQSLKALLLKHRVKKLLLVYGKKSVKENGIYDIVLDTCKSLAIAVYEESGVEPNPDIESVISGQTTLKANDIDFVLAAGGGSVLDAAKAMAFSYYLKTADAVWDVFMRQGGFDKALPIGTILTLAATGSETNGNTVISNRALNDKRSVASPLLVPQFSIIDPTYTLKVNKHHTIAGSIDIMMHVFEQYFSPTQHTETSDYMSFGVLKSVIENTRKILNGDDGYHVRANLSWASTIALSWILQQGKKGDWASHRLSYPITMDYDITHGYALAIIQPAWMEVALKANPEAMGPRLNALGDNVFNVKGADQTIQAIKTLFNEFGAPTTFKQAGVDLNDQAASKMAAQTLKLGPIGSIFKIETKEAYTIFKTATA